jgi:hypothetical protein
MVGPARASEYQASRRPERAPQQDENRRHGFRLAGFLFAYFHASTHLVVVSIPLAMRYFTVLLLLFACTCALLPAACAQKATPQKVTTKKPRKKAAAKAAQPQAPRATADLTPVLVFERTPCFGNCPAYSMRVFADGRVAYEGRGDVPTMGAKELKLAPAALADMLRRAQEAHFEQFQARYSQNTSDLPGTVVSVKQADGQLKTVVVEEGAPENVRAFFAYLSNEFDQLAGLYTDK